MSAAVELELVVSHDMPYRACSVCGWLIRPVDLVLVGEFVARHRTCESPVELAVAEVAAA